MSTRIQTFTVEAQPLRLFVSDCPSCGVVFGLPAEMEKRRRDDHKSFYCPNGHSMSFSGPTKAEREAQQAKERVDHLWKRLAAELDRATLAEHEAAEARASEVRLRWRVGHGVCPCCQRTFPGLAAHVATKHPEFIESDLANLSEKMRDTLGALHRQMDSQDAATLDVNDAGLHWSTIRALSRRGLVETINMGKVALTETGWPLAAQVATTTPRAESAQPEESA